MNLKNIFPSPERIAMEVIIVTGGIIGAAWVISRFPAVQKFIQQNGVTVKASNGDVLF